MNWKSRARSVLHGSLNPIPRELDELDWKSNISSDGKRLAEHICAFSNHPGGGLFVYGINNDASFTELSRESIEHIITKLANVARNNLAEPVHLEHDIQTYEGHDILFIYVPEYRDKPLYTKEKGHHAAFHRVAGHTERMTDRQIRAMMAASLGTPFEKRVAKEGVTADDVLHYIHYQCFFAIQEKNCPDDPFAILSRLCEFGICEEQGDSWNITNLGALLFARDLSQFESLYTRAVIVRHYRGKNNRDMVAEVKGKLGYAVGFSGLIQYIAGCIAEEFIGVQRMSVYPYPLVAIRELIANALVHQDFEIRGIPLSVEIFSDKIVITNPGASLNDVNRLIDLPPHSRNEHLAESMFLLKLCERRGSGIDRAIAAIEEMHLPAPCISSGEYHTRVTLYPYKSVKEMSKDEKVLACYQHACLLNEDGERLNNKAVRERFSLNKNQTDVASRIISDSLEAKLLKVYEDGSSSKKYATYVPYYYYV